MQTWTPSEIKEFKGGKVVIRLFQGEEHVASAIGKTKEEASIRAQQICARGVSPVVISRNHAESIRELANFVKTVVVPKIENGLAYPNREPTILNYTNLVASVETLLDVVETGGLVVDPGLLKKPEVYQPERTE